MSLNKKIKIISLIIIFSIIFLGIVIFNFRILHKQNSKDKLPPPLSSPYVEGGRVGVLPVKISPQIDDISFKNDILGEISVYDFMSELRKEGKINFVEKNYIGMGKLITEIDGIRSNGEKNWIYYVNGTEAQVGVSNYKIKKGDIVSWKYEKYE